MGGPRPGRAGPPHRRLPPPAVHRGRARRRTPGSSTSARAAGCGSRRTASATSSPGGTPVPGPGRRHRLAPRLRVEGGAYDGPLGVVSALAAVDVLRDRGLEPARPIGVAVFREEEGSRFPLACLGSRLATGAARLGGGPGAAGPGRGGARATSWTARAGSDLLDGVGTFVELHVEQGRDLVDRDAAVGVASGIWPHGRYRFDFAGRADHAGTTRMEDRHDPMLAYAMTVLAANKQARLAGQRATFGRVAVRAQRHQRGAVAGDRLARRPGVVRPRGCSALVADIERLAVERAGRDGTDGRGHAGVGDPRGRVRRRRSRSGSPELGAAWPVIPTAAGHDAGILSGGRDPDRDALRPQPHRRLALAGGVGRRPPTAWPASRRSPTPWRCWPADAGMTGYVLEHAWVDGEVALGRARADRRRAVHRRRRRSVARAPSGCAGLTLPGLANCHSHAFHRALRGRTQRGGGHVLDLARADVRPRRRGSTPTPTASSRRRSSGRWWRPGSPPSASSTTCTTSRDGTAVRRAERDGARARRGAAREAGLRIALLDTCYLAAGHRPAASRASQRRFSDGTAEAWQERADELTADVGGDVVVGAAIHSVRAVPLDEMRLVAEWADRFETPLHVHLSEQVAENEECLDVYGRTPTEVLAEAGALDRPHHRRARHAPDRPRRRPARRRRRGRCFCPTTERDLGDGIGPSRRCSPPGSRLTLGSDSHAVVDLFEEMRALEMDERLGPPVAAATGRRAELLRAATADGHASLGFADAGRIAVGQRADLVTLDVTSPADRGRRGATPETAAFAATAADVVHVVSGGRVVHRAGDAADVGATLDKVVRGLWEGQVSTLLVTGIAELVTNDPAPRRASSGWSPTRPSSCDGGRVAWTGRPRRRRPADAAYDVGGRAVMPGFVDSHSHLVFAGDRAPEFAARMAGQRYDGGGIRYDRRRDPRRDRRAADRQPAAAPRRDAAPGDDDGRGQERLRADRRATRRGRSRSQRGSPPRRPSSGRTSSRRSTPTTRPATSTSSPAPMLEACAPHARWVDAFCERGAFDADQARAVLDRRRGRRAAGAAARQPARPRARGPARLRARAGGRRPLHLPLRRRRRRARLVRDGGHAAARRRVLDPVALPGRPGAPRRRGAGWRSPPTATRAPATRARCRCASRWPCGRCA